MKSAILLFACICMLSFTGCKKDDESSVEPTTKQLKSVISDNGIKRVIPREEDSPGTTYIFGDYGRYYNFQNGFFTLYSAGSETSYNLDILKTYRIEEVNVADGENNGKEKVLLLIFK